MRGKKYIGIALSIFMAAALAGCGERFPDLTKEQYDQTVEYAAGLLMKYSNNGQNKLTYVDAKGLEKQREKEAAETLPEVEEIKPEPKPEPQKPDETAFVPVTDEPSVEDSSQQEEQETQIQEESIQEVEQQEAAAEESTTEKEESASEEENALVLSSDESKEILDDVFLSYQGYAVSSTYPESSKSYVVNADKGKKLLVLRFDLYNGSDSSKEVNLIPLNLLYQIVLNGNNLGYSAVTFLPNDLSSYSGTIDSRAHESVVILTQINADDATNIESLGMIVSQDGVEQKVILK